jgi:hypothetical protein
VLPPPKLTRILWMAPEMRVFLTVSSGLIKLLQECQEIFRFRRFSLQGIQLRLTVVLASRPSFFELDPIKNINLGRLFEIITLGPLEEAAANAIIGRN